MIFVCLISLCVCQMGVCISKKRQWDRYEVWANSFMKKLCAVHDLSFPELFECSYNSLPRALRKKLPKDIFDDVCKYDKKAREECTLYSNYRFKVL
jgi:hypothetical protein